MPSDVYECPCSVYDDMMKFASKLIRDAADVEDERKKRALVALTTGFNVNAPKIAPFDSMRRTPRVADVRPS